MPIITVDRSTPFDPEELLGQMGFEVQSEKDQRSLEITRLDTSRLRLEFGMCNNLGIPLYYPQRVGWLRAQGYILPDGKILEALKEHNAFPEEMKGDHPYLPNKVLRVHFDGTLLRSTYDGDDYSMYATFNRVQNQYEIAWLGPWAGEQPSLVILP